MDSELTPLPAKLAPMLATAGELPSARDEAQWAFETKWDGARAVVFVDSGRARALSRNDRDVSVSYPELLPLAAAMSTTQAVLDCEIVAFGEHGAPSFSRLQRRMHVTKSADAHRLSQTDPVVFVIFDLLHLGDRSLLEVPYVERRAELATLDLSGESWLSPDYFTGSGADLLRASKEHGLEGIVAKKLTSKYRPGQRSPDWRKIKNIRTQEIVVVGWHPGQGRRTGRIGSLLMALPGDGGLHYAGSVGTGFSEAVLDDLYRTLLRDERKTSPLAAEIPAADRRDAHWVAPRLVGEVAFTEWTPDGRLRHPAWRGLRPDKAIDEVVRES